MTLPASDEDGIDALIGRAMSDPGTITEEEIARILDAVDPGSDRNTTEALFSIASHDPGTVDSMVDRLERRLADGNRGERSDASMIITQLAQRYPESVVSAAPTLIDRIEDDSVVVRGNAVQTLGHVAAESPEAVVPAVPDLAPWLRDEILLNRLYAVEIAYQVATERPEEVEPLIPDLGAVLVDRYEEADELPRQTERNRYANRRIREQTQEARGQRAVVRSRAAVTFVELAQALPDAVAEELPRFIDVIENEDTLVIDEVLDVLTLLARERPAALYDVTGPLGGVLEGPYRNDTKAKAALALAFLADGDEAAVAEAAEPAIPTVIELLDADDSQIRGAATSLLMYVGERYPEAVGPATTTLVGLLDDEYAFVRGSAARVLGIVGDDDARARLKELAEESREPEVRQAATRAVEAIDERIDD